jgi:hypothetical protein
MPDEWRFFPCSIGDDPASIYLNVGLSKTIAQAPIWLAKASVTYKSPRPNGLPTKDEFEAVVQIED